MKKSQLFASIAFVGMASQAAAFGLGHWLNAPARNNPHDPRSAFFEAAPETPVQKSVGEAATLPTATATPSGAQTLASCAAAPVIDGILNDAVWTGPTYPVTNVVVGSISGVSGSFQTRYDATYFYLAVSVTDPTLYYSVSNSDWNNTAVEVFFNSNYPTNNAPLSSGDFQYIVDWSGNSRTCACLNGAYGSSTGVLWGTTSTATGYSMEMAVPWTTLGKTPSAGLPLGFDLEIDVNHSNPGTSGRTAQLAWSGNGTAYEDSSQFGLLTLGTACSTTPVTTPTATLSATATPSFTAAPSSTASPTITLTAVSTPSSTATPAGTTSWHVRAGGTAYTDTLGQAWVADIGFSGGSTASTTHAITAPGSDPVLYQTERWGNPFTYTFAVTPGTYQVTLKLAEIYWTATGQRIFNASINGTQVLTNLDIFSQVGEYVADDKVFSNIQPNSSGQIVIELGPASVDNAKVAAIAIIPQPATTPTVTATATRTATATATLTLSPIPSSTSTVTATATATRTATPVAATSWHVRAGGTAYTDTLGQAWVADTGFSGGNTASTTHAVTAPGSDPVLYQTERWGNPFTYTFAVSPGTYQVTLKLAEIYWTATGQRIFNASINGTQVLTNLDIYSQVGEYVADDKVFSNIQPNSSGQIVIELGPASVDNAKVAAIAIIPQPATTPTSTATKTVTPLPSPTPSLTSACPAPAPNFGPNVLIFDPSMSSASIQSQLDSIYSQQSGNQFGSARYALLFKPGSYSNNIQVGYYTQALGLGTTPDAVLINGGVTSNAALSGNNATCNFWEGAENMAVVPTSGTDQWAVSQACPMRRMHIKGNIVLEQNGGWASGGFLSDSLIDGQINSGSQQQWISRNSQWGSWAGSNWNMVFVGDINAPSSATWPSPPNTVISQSPVSREKPFLQVDSCGNYSVFVPALASNSQGTTWASGATPGQAIPLTQFYIAQASVDTAATMNAALAQGKNLLLSPGVYSLTAPLTVNNANTVVLGLGLATLLAQNGVTAMTVADVDGVKISGILFDAGATSSPILLQVGPSGASASHAANPTSLHDLFFRVGGAAVGKAAICLQVNSNNVIGDDLWIWRADHTNGVGWTVNTANNGIVVNGANVTIYGLAVEHFQQYQTLWNGNGGSVYFYQSEAPYDPPNQAAWMNGSEDGYASYKVANTVTSHQAYGVGIYCYFDVNPAVQLTNAIEVPTSGLDGAMFHNMTTVSLGGVGQITSIIDGYGASVNSTNGVATLAY